MGILLRFIMFLSFAQTDRNSTIVGGGGAVVKSVKLRHSRRH